MKTKINKKGAMALSQIMILLVGIIAISSAVGGGIGVVSGSDDGCVMGTNCFGSKCVGDKERHEGKCVNDVCVYNKVEDCVIGCVGGVCINEEQQTENSEEITEDDDEEDKGGWIDLALGILGIFGSKKAAEQGAGALAGSAIQSILANAGIAIAIYVTTNQLLQILGMDASTSESIAQSFTAGYVAAYIAKKALSQVMVEGAKFMGLGVAGLSTGIGIAVTLIWFAATFKSKTQRPVSYECYVWDAERRGENCEECNKGILPCSEYRCRSLGQGCELVNKGLENQMCVWVDKGVNPAIIKAWDSALSSQFEYTPDNAISPPDRGVKVVPTNNLNGCVPIFTPITFGITLENDEGEPKMARCKISSTRESSFEEMPNRFFSQGQKNYNHSFTMSIPGVEAFESENISIEHGVTNNLYVRCEDVNGNTNLGNFIFKFCVDETPDSVQPTIIGTDWLPSEGGPIAFNTSSVDLNVYINKPSECKWSYIDQDYETMESEMSCSATSINWNIQAAYPCETTLSGIKDRVENKFYFRCKSYPNKPEVERIENSQSFEFTLIGTQPLVINSVKPNNTLISDSTDIVKVTFEVETSAGYDEGKSSCYWSETGNDGDYIMFFGDEEIDQYKHTQDLWLPAGEHKYHIKCSDAAGNSDTAEINFTIETDTSAPIIVRAFHESNYLKIITNEEAECVYSLDDCEYEFKDGLEMMTSDNIYHSETWDTDKVYRIKCKDEYGNQPYPDECNLIVRPSDF